MDLQQRMGVDWKELADDVAALRVDCVQQYVSAGLEGKKNYRMVQRTLSEYLFAQVRQYAA